MALELHPFLLYKRICYHVTDAKHGSKNLDLLGHRSVHIDLLGHRSVHIDLLGHRSVHIDLLGLSLVTCHSSIDLLGLKLVTYDNVIIMQELQTAVNSK
jgi:hypothetical protein